MDDSPMRKKKEKAVQFFVERELFDAFASECKARGWGISFAIRELMKAWMGMENITGCKFRAKPESGRPVPMPRVHDQATDD
jgi:hypothetical protein